MKNEIIGEKIKKDWLPKYLYHISPQSNRSLIKKSGIIPKTGGRTKLNLSYSPRIYLATSLIAAYSLMEEFQNWKDEEYDIYEIDTKDLTDDFYDDPKFMHGVFTTQSISFNNITKIIDPKTLYFDPEDIEQLYLQDWHDYEPIEPKVKEMITTIQDFKLHLEKKKRLEWNDSDAPDANGRFKEYGIKKLARWLIRTRNRDLKRIVGSLNQQIAFNKNDEPEFAAKMKKTRKEVYRQLGREDLLD